MEDEEWERFKRETRYGALKRIQPIFGLTPAEQAEFEELAVEFERLA